MAVIVPFCRSGLAKRVMRSKLKARLEGGVVVRQQCEDPIELSSKDHRGSLLWEQLFNNRLPVQLLKEVVFEGWRVEVHTLFPDLLLQFADTLGFDSIEPVDFIVTSSHKKYRFMAPAYFKACRGSEVVIIAAVSPGRESAYMHADFIARFLDHIAREKYLVSIIRHTDLEKQIVDWTGLDERFVAPSDHVVIGFANEVCQLIKGQSECVFVSAIENTYFSSKRYRFENGEVVNFLDVHFDFIGSISAKIAGRLAGLGCANIIFCGRLYGIGHECSAYTQIYSPARYIYQELDGSVRYIIDLQNPLHAVMPGSNTGWHFSQSPVPDPYNMDHIAQLGLVHSVDTELGAIAAELEDINHKLGRDVGFCPIQFAPEMLDKCSDMRPFSMMDRKRRHYSLRLITIALKRVIRSL